MIELGGTIDLDGTRFSSGKALEVGLDLLFRPLLLVLAPLAVLLLVLPLDILLLLLPPCRRRRRLRALVAWMGSL